MTAVGKYNGSRTKVASLELIKNMLAAGEPIVRIAKQAKSSKHSVRNVRDQHANDIAQRKELIKASVSRLVMNGFNKLNELVDEDKLTPGLLMTTTGMAADKYILLNNDPQQINVTHTIRPAETLYARLDALQRTLASQGVESSVTTQPSSLHLPIGGVIEAEILDTHTPNPLSTTPADTTGPPVPTPLTPGTPQSTEEQQQ